MYESRCGLLCSKCANREEYGCEGCINMPEGYWGGSCEIKICCEMKKYDHCGQCNDFPCQLLKDISYDTETGDNGDRLMNCKEWVDKVDDDKWSFKQKLFTGFSSGIIAGLVIGIIQNMLTAWLITGAALGIGIAIMFYITKKNK